VFMIEGQMRISVTEAKSRLTDLVRRAEAGDDVVLTRHGQAAVRLVPVTPMPDARRRRALLDAVRMSGGARATSGPEAARSQDFLYGDDGLPGSNRVP
jgi:prevent-host-death family protein